MGEIPPRGKQSLKQDLDGISEENVSYQHTDNVPAKALLGCSGWFLGCC